MASNFLSGAAPPELVLLILDACESVKDALALASTCRPMFHVGRAHVIARLWSELRGSVPCFEEALIASRMTELVAHAERRGELPPLHTSPGELASSRRKPTIDELKAAFALSRLVALLERLFHKPSPYDPYDVAPPGYEDVTEFELVPQEDERVPEWQARLHKAIYRALIAGAALAGAYNEPIFAAKLQPDLELTPGKCPKGLSAKQLEFLNQFAVYNRDAAPEAEEAVFGPLGTWLLETILADQEGRKAMGKRFRENYGRAWYCQNNPGCPVSPVDGGSHSDAHFVVWEVMQMLWAQDHIYDAASRHESPCKEYETRPTTALAVVLGVFHAEEVGPLEYINKGLETPTLKARLAYVPWEETVMYSLEDGEGGTVARGKSAAVYFPKDPEEWGPTRSGSLALKFFKYFLRRHLGLRLSPTRADGSTNPGYYHFLECLGIFSHDDVEGRTGYTGGRDLMDADFLDGTEILTRFDPPLILTARQTNLPDGWSPHPAPVV